MRAHFKWARGRVIAVDRLQDRLDSARSLGAEIINFDAEDPVEAIMALTGGISVDRVIDVVGVDAQHPDSLPAASADEKEQAESEIREITPEQHEDGPNWVPGNAPTQVLNWAVAALAKAGTLGVIGVYPPNDRFFRSARP